MSTAKVMLMWQGPGWYSFRAYQARDGTMKVLMVRLAPHGKPRHQVEELAASWRLSEPFKLRSSLEYASHARRLYDYGEAYRRSMIKKGDTRP